MKKKLLFFAGSVVVAVTLSLYPTQSAKSQGNCNGCWWNAIDKMCCENGDMCCGSCDTQVQ
jgi:hypothetical protein